jgi:dienelactone hydrolase
MPSFRTVRPLFALLVATSCIHAQVNAGGGGPARPDQYFSALPEYSTGIFTRSGTDLTAGQRKTRSEAWRTEIRKQLFIPARLPELQIKRWSTFKPMPGVLADRVTYATADGMRVPAVIYRPDPALLQHGQKLPGIVVVNGHGSDKFGWYAFYSGLLFARAGAVVVTYDPIGEGERNAHKLSRERPSPHDAEVDLPQWGQHLAGLMQTDLMQAVSYLRAQPEVDPKRIAVVGYSMGAFISGIAGAVDTRIHALVLSGGGTFDADHQYFDSGKLPCQSPPYRSLAVLGDRSAVLYALNADRGPTLVMNGAEDGVMRMSEHPPTWFDDVRSRAIRLHGIDLNMFTTILYPGISHRPSWVNLDGVLWLNHQIHFALWNDEDIRKAGTTHISKWIQANNVDIAPNYIPEEREGGIDAVGTGFPAIPRKDLMVLPDAEWNKQKSVLTYEGWADTMKRSMSRIAAH